MSKMQSGSGQNQKTTRTATTALVLAFSTAAFLAAGAVQGAKPKPAPEINATICKNILGVWAPRNCTIPDTNAGVANSDFKIGKGNKLDVKGSLTVSPGVTIANDGTIVVENVGGVVPPAFDDGGLMAGILVLGTIDNSGTITVQNASDNTAGILVSVSASPSVPPVPNPFLVVPGVLTNSGVIDIRNAGNSQGINNLGTLDNVAGGTIAIGNSGASSVGIRNGRDSSLASKYYIVGTMTNAGSMTVANSGDSGGRGISNAGAFTNAATGTFAITPSTVSGDLAMGMRNNGSFTNHGTFINNRGKLNEVDPWSTPWGSYNMSPGAMMNYGRTYVGTASDGTGSFYNEAFMFNFGEITTYGVLADLGHAMINYGTLFNFGAIGGGGNIGICIDEPDSGGGC